MATKLYYDWKGLKFDNTKIFNAVSNIVPPNASYHYADIVDRYNNAINYGEDIKRFLDYDWSKIIDISFTKTITFTNFSPPTLPLVLMTVNISNVSPSKDIIKLWTPLEDIHKLIKFSVPTSTHIVSIGSISSLTGRKAEIQHKYQDLIDICEDKTNTAWIDLISTNV